MHIQSDKIWNIFDISFEWSFELVLIYMNENIRNNFISDTVLNAGTELFIPPGYHQYRLQESR